jgi:hypothetical protein
MKLRWANCIPVILVLSTVPCFTQEKAPDKQAPRDRAAYRVDLVLSESEGGKRTNTRNYSFVIEESRAARLRQGLRVPVPAGGVSGTGTVTQFQYMDIGLNIDCDLREVESGVHVGLLVDESSLSREQPVSTLSAPVVRQLRNQVDAVIPAGKQTLVSSVEELDSKKRMDIEVTATKVR